MAEKIATLQEFIGWDEFDSTDEFMKELDTAPRITSDGFAEVPTNSLGIDPKNPFASIHALTGAKVEEIPTKGQAVKEDKRNEKEEPKQEAKNDIQGDDFFEDEQTITNQNDSAKESGEARGTKIEVLSYLLDNDIIELEEDQQFEDLTEEDANEILSERLPDMFGKKIKGGIKEVLNHLPEKLKNANRYAINGGDPDEYFTKLSQVESTKLHDKLDLSREANQELIMSELLRQEGYDQDYIDTNIEYLKDSNKLENISKMKYDKWRKDYTTRMDALAEEQEQLAYQRQQEIISQKEKYASYLHDIDSVGEVPLTKDLKKTLPDYINVPTVVLTNGNRITQFQYDLFFEMQKNPEAMVQLAALVKNRNKDNTINLKPISNRVVDKFAKEVKSNIRRTKDVAPRGTNSGGMVVDARNVADFFN